MRYLRMLSNSIVAAGLASAFVVVLFLALNPQLPLSPRHLLAMATTVGLYYTVHLTAVFYGVLVLRQLLAAELFSPAWISIGVLVWLSAAASFAAAAITLTNAQAFAPVLHVDTARRLALIAPALAAAGLLFAGVGVIRSVVWPRGRFWCAGLFLAVAAASIGVPLAIRGAGTPAVLGAYPIELGAVVKSDRPGHVTILAVDGASLEFLSAATAEGRLPNFGRLLDAGATEHLATLRPTSAEVVWSAAATGKLPQKNGVRSAAVYRIAESSAPVQLLPEYVYAHGLLRFGLLAEEASTASALRSRPLWTILSGAGIEVGVVAWPLTDPAPTLRGYVVSDTYLRLKSTPSGIDEAAGLYPPDLQREIASIADAANDTAPIVAAAEDVPGADDTPPHTDRVYDRIVQELRRIRPVQVELVRYRAIDAVGHRYLRFAMPSDFGDVTDEERRSYGGVLEEQYRLVDAAIGRAIAGMGADDLLLVVSPYGMAPLSPGKRLLELVAGDPGLSGTHDDAPDGFVIAYGSRVARGRRAARGAIVDIAPTVLYYLGLPVGRDMDGAVRTELFQATYTDERPITFIPTYDR